MRTIKNLVVLFVAMLPIASMGQKLNIGFVYPAGGQRGTTFEITVGGQNLSAVDGVVVSGNGVTGEIVSNSARDSKGRKRPRKRKNIQEQDNLQIAERVVVRITIDPKAEIGMRDLRLSTPNGYSNRLFFEVGQYPELKEAEGNNVMAGASVSQSTPVTFNGQVLPGKKDYFRFSARKGQTIVCSVKARELMPYLADAVPGWFQSVLTMYDSNGKEVAYSDDYHLLPDPVIICEIPHDGDYILEIKDAIYRGREDFVYRINVGEIPFITSISPLGGRSGSKTRVKLHGVNLSSDHIIVKPAKKYTGRIQINAKGKGGYVSNSVPFEVTELNETRYYSSKSNTMESAVEVVPGSVVNGAITSPAKVDWYYFDAMERGEQWQINIAARKLGSLLDSKIAIYNSTGKLIASNDDMPDQSEGMQIHHADAGLVKKIYGKGRYYVCVSDVQRKGAPDGYDYRLYVQHATPDYELRIEPSSISIPSGGTAVFTVFAIRKFGFKGDVTISVDGLPDGYKLSHNVLQGNDTRLRMTVTAPKGAAEQPLNLKVTGTAPNATGGVTKREALPAEEMMQAFYIPHLIPTQSFNVNVASAQPFSITAFTEDDKPLQLSRDTTVAMKVRIDRTDGYDQPIQLMLNIPPRGVRMTPVMVQPGQTEATVYIECLKYARPLTDVMLVVAGTVKAQRHKGRTFGAAANKINAAVIAFSPAVVAKIPDLTPEQKAERAALRAKRLKERQKAAQLK